MIYCENIVDVAPLFLLLVLVCNSCLHMDIMNRSDAIDISLDPKTYRILVQPGHFEVLK